MGNCCGSDGAKGHGHHGAAYQTGKRGEGGSQNGHGAGLHEDDINSALNTEEASEIGRLSRAESVSKMTNEPSQLMATLRRKFIVTRAAIQHGISEDVEQFSSEIQDSISEMREKDKRRVREWLESVVRALRGRNPTEFPPVPKKKKASTTSQSSGHHEHTGSGGSGHEHGRSKSESDTTSTHSTGSESRKTRRRRTQDGTGSSTGKSPGQQGLESGSAGASTSSAADGGSSSKPSAVAEGASPGLGANKIDRTPPSSPNSNEGAWKPALLSDGIGSPFSTGSNGGGGGGLGDNFSSPNKEDRLSRADSAMAQADGDMGAPHVPLDRRRSILTHELLGKQQSPGASNNLGVPQNDMDMRSH